MLRRAREVGPVFLIPAAWTVVAAVHLGAVSEHTLYIAHVVMTTLLAVFAVTAYRDMREGVLRVWWVVIAVGFFAAASGTAGFLLDSSPLPHAVALYGWMLLPAVGLFYTGRHVDVARVVYDGGGALCCLGAVLYAAAPALPVADSAAVVAGLAAVGLGQTAGILDAAVRY